VLVSYAQGPGGWMNEFLPLLMGGCDCKTEKKEIFMKV
jgi:hypothetical protein